MPGRTRNLGGQQQSGTRQRNLGGPVTSSSGRQRNLGTNSTGPHHSIHGIGGFFHNLAHGAEAAARGFGPGVVTLAGDIIHDNTSNPGDIGKSKTYRDVVKPMADAYAQKYDPLFRGDFRQFGKNVYADPFGTFLDATAFVTGGAGASARAGRLASRVRLVSNDSRLAQLGRVEKLTVPNPAKRAGQGGKDVTIKLTHKNPVIRKRQQLANRAANALPADTPLVGSSARFARVTARNAMRPGLTLATKAHPFTQAFNRLNKIERAVWHVQARKIEPEMWKNLLDEGAIKNPKGTEAATMSVLDKTKFNKLYKTGNKRITDALEKGRHLSDLMTDEKVTRGMLDEVTAAEAPYSALRAVHGADFIGKKEADRTLPTRRLVATRREVEAMQKQFDENSAKVKTAGFTRDQQKLINASAKLPPGPDVESVVPRTIPEAKAHLANLQSIYDQFLKDAAGGEAKLDKGEMARQREINQDNGKFRKQQSGKTKSGRASGASGNKIQSLKLDVAAEKRLQLEQHVHDVALAHPDLLAAQKFLALSKRIDELHAAINAHEEASFLADHPIEGAALGTKTVTKPGPRVKPFPMPSGKMVTAEGAMLAPKGAVKLEMQGAALSLKKTRLEQLERAYANRVAKLGGVKERGIADLPGHSIEEIAQGLADQGRMQPFYTHDASVTRATRFGRSPGIGAPAKMGSARQNMAVLLSKGMINLHGDSLSSEFQRFARHVARQDVHAALLEHAAKVPESGLPKGWTHLLAAGQKATFTEKATGIVKAGLEKGETRDDLLKRFTTKKDEGDLAVDGEGHKLMIPDAVAKVLTHGATSESNLVKRLGFELPTSIWKHMVLGLRPAYMANILLSQHILGFLQMAPDGAGITAYFNHLIPGARFGKLTEETIQDVLPEQAHGTFAQSMGGSSSKGARIRDKAYEGVMPATLRVEKWLRRLMVDGWAQSEPEIRAAMARNGGDINAAMREVAKTHPHVLDEISQKVDHAQGNYRTYSRAEQKLRAVIPFYGWDRHIVQSTYRILAEHPLRADVAAHLGEQGHAINERDFGALPTYLQDLVKISPMDWAFGHDPTRVTGVSTKAVNPFATDADLAQTLWSAVHGRAGTHTEEAGNVNPILAGLYEQLTGRSLLTGAPLKDKLNQGFMNVPLRIALQTPQARLLEHGFNIAPLGRPKHEPASKVTSRLSAAGYFGFPAKRLDLAHEHLIAGLQNKPPR